MTKFTATKIEIEQSSTRALWDIIRHTILATEEAILRYVYARAELNKRGFTI